MKNYTSIENSVSGSCIANERGVAIIAALLILMLLSFVAITSTTTVTTEKRMVRSQIVFDENFYLAESAALEGIQKLANQPINNTAELIAANTNSGSSENYDLLTSIPAKDLLNDNEILDQSGDDDEITQDDLDEMRDISDLDPGTHRFVAQTRGAGAHADNEGIGVSSLAHDSGSHGGNSEIYDYMSYGITSRYNGRSIVKIGYKRKVLIE